MMTNMNDYCWHCAICDVTMSLDDMSSEELSELKAEVLRGDSMFAHPSDDGESHPLTLIMERN